MPDILSVFSDEPVLSATYATNVAIGTSILGSLGVSHHAVLAAVIGIGVTTVLGIVTRGLVSPVAKVSAAVAVTPPTLTLVPPAAQVFGLPDPRRMFRMGPDPFAGVWVPEPFEHEKCWARAWTSVDADDVTEWARLSYGSNTSCTARGGRRLGLCMDHAEEILGPAAA